MPKNCTQIGIWKHKVKSKFTTEKENGKNLPRNQIRVEFIVLANSAKRVSALPTIVHCAVLKIHPSIVLLSNILCFWTCIAFHIFINALKFSGIGGADLGKEKWHLEIEKMIYHSRSWYGVKHPHLGPNASRCMWTLRTSGSPPQVTNVVLSNFRRFRLDQVWFKAGSGNPHWVM